MFGEYKIEEFEIGYEDFYAEIKKQKNLYVYVRSFRNEKVEKLIASKDVKVLVNPVEPVNLPKPITNYLLIEFEKPISIEPREFSTLYVTFPIEVAVLLVSRDIKILDIFSFVKQKFTLYGDSTNGIICKYWTSKIFEDLPELDWLKEGLIELKIYNESEEWQEMKKAVFNVYDMKIYYDEKVVSSAYVRILSSKVAETGFNEISYGKKSIELYTAKKIPIIKKKFFMEWGL
ncbi:MAG: DUF432 domain-containing protein [Archaeoglobaceae archaeon]|nr:DUF432 domain-containing protein [Archaeoglobaceae archaeon]MCX8151842.1 DUF432 domain-containing protein [Archaeoglobaceae archaeon]MDW8014326.1 DUF432 domain-containing protein [Archaeoglobaceae archaeon]